MKYLCTFVDLDGLMRLREDDECYRYPILLPSKHKLLDILIQDYYKIRIKENYYQSIPTPFPEDRVNYAYLAGTLYLKGGEKAWILLFTCTVYRAVHFELVLSLSTGVLLQGLQRPRVIYSDNGNNFIVANNGFDSLDWSTIKEESCSQRIQWKFIPHTTAWWGGWWERIVQMVKKLLKELSTIPCEVESVINSRPLSNLSEDTKDLVPLTPAMFLQDSRPIGLPDIDNLENICLCKWARFLQRLPMALEIGDVVLIGSDHKRRLEWLVGRILEMYPGKDGRVRVVQVKISSRKIMRPIQRICPLEVSASQESPSVAETRVGGTVRGDDFQKRGSRTFRVG
ncbi:hypothetical protein PR048_021124 [Dryococelus australis]|uniref:DUF5641 domain-containing protein n=1 Tax=Dryococelus australis TaxID=614101 RepID=A0ABQ9GXC6_9NEOP|nr:hypothetical protein PR048_021124 [Dryococelus australis]